MKIFALSLAGLLVSVFALPSRGAEVTAEKIDGGVAIKIDGKLFTDYLIKSGNKPILWPINDADGQPVTRAFPMVPQPAGEMPKEDHPHHRSLWFDHGDVNGISFWDERTEKNAGQIVHRDFAKIQSGNPAVVVTDNDWIGPDGKKQCEDRRHLAFGTLGHDERYIDFDVAIHASNGDVKFGDTKEGSFGVRVANTVKVDAKKGGEIINSAGEKDGKASARRASWVDYHGPIGDKTVGIAILNHPSSFRYPTYWHVRTYGLFAANPFGVHDFAEANKDKPDPATSGAYTLPAGKTLEFHYRAIIHPGDEKTAKIAEAFADYAKTKPAE